jgi:hypothetical protein
VTTFQNAFDGCPGLTRAIYDKALVYWDSLTLQSGVTFDANQAYYSPNSAAATARTNIATGDSWTFGDAGTSSDNVWTNTDSDNDANIAANWSQSGVPTTGETAYLSDAFDDDCTLSSNLSFANLIIENGYGGTLDIDGNDLDLSGNLTVGAGATVADTTGGNHISITGYLNIHGTVASGVTWSDADIDTLGGYGNADWCTVSNSTNSGTVIDASDVCTDNGGNTGWNFLGFKSLVSFGGI